MSTVLEGFMLLPAIASTYQGVDREPFEPLLPPTAPMRVDVPSRISDQAHEQWRRDLYRLAEEYAVGSATYLFRDVNAARRIQRDVSKHLGGHELVWARIVPLDQADPRLDRPGAVFLGYDVAYRGGDFYSAIKNGLHINPDEHLVLLFSAATNSAGLFDDRDQALSFTDEFIRTSLTESRHRFFSYQLFRIGDTPLH